MLSFRGRRIRTIQQAWFIDATKFKGRFIHGLGHSIGLATHDGGGLNSVSDIVLRPGMVFTNEPGVYVPGFGGVRIEDDVLITADGNENLSAALPRRPERMRRPVPATGHTKPRLGRGSVRLAGRTEGADTSQVPA